MSMENTIGFRMKKIRDDANINQEAMGNKLLICLLYTSPSPRDTERSRMPSSA